MKFVVWRRARRHIQRLEDWWFENKTYGERKRGLFRRLLLSRTDYHLYYRYQRVQDTIIIEAVCGATRGQPPKL